MLIAVPLGIDNSIGIGGILVNTGHVALCVNRNTDIECRILIALVSNASLFLVCQQILVG